MTMQTIRVYTITDDEPHAPGAPAFDCEPDHDGDVRWLGVLLFLCGMGVAAGIAMILYGLLSS